MGALLPCSYSPSYYLLHLRSSRSGCLTKPSCLPASSFNAALPRASGRVFVLEHTRPCFVSKSRNAFRLWSSAPFSYRNIAVYYLPLWFQVIQGKSAVESGIDLLPMVLVIAAMSIANGQLVSLVGYYTPSFIIGACANAIGAGLLTTLGIRSSEGKWIGYQILYGFGLGLASQAPNMAAQTVLPKQDVAIGASLMFFG